MHYVVILDFSNCEADIKYYFQRYDPDTRQWLLKDFDSWFSNPGNSRAYVLLGDAAVGKSVMAAVMAQRAQESGNMGAAFFCRHYDGTRRDPRYLLGTIAYQLCNCHNQYNKLLGGEEEIHRMLANCKLGVHELFTKLLEEPLNQCKSCTRKLVVIDALDESEYWSREDFLDLIMNRFPFLPKWLVFFITSRPEDTVQYRLKKYNPCIKICAGNSKSVCVYQQHKQDIQRFLEKRVNFAIFPDPAAKLTEKCNGMFLHAFYIAEQLKNRTHLRSDDVSENMNDCFRQNFKRVYDILGEDFYQKLFGCVLMTPSPLPLSFISFLLQKEDSSLDEQEVIDAVSQFVALRDTDKTFAFLHGLIPNWLTDEEKASRRLFVDKKKASAYFTNIVVQFLNAFLQEEHQNPSHKIDVVNYILCVGFRLLFNIRCEDCEGSKIVFNCLTNYRFLQQRISSSKIGIYSLIDDLEFSTQRLVFDATKIGILRDIRSALQRDKIILVENHQLLHSCLSSSTRLVRNKVIPENMSGAGFESNTNIKLVIEFLSHMVCGAFSHDKKLFAAGKSRCIYLCDGRSFEKILGPVEVMNESILHLQFSPDDKFVFFGRPDKCFSVQKKRVVKMTRFLKYTCSLGLDYQTINHSLIWSKDGMWFLRRNIPGIFELVSDKVNAKTFLDPYPQDIKEGAFTDDSNVLVYNTTSTSPNLVAISLVSGKMFRSISGSYPVYCLSGDGQDLGFIFSNTNESMVVFLRDLPASFLFNSWRVSKSIMTAEAVDVTFTSCDSVSLLFSNGSVGSWKIVDGSLVSSGRGMLSSELMEFQQVKIFEPKKYPAKKLFFSQSGGLILVDQGCRIVLFEGEKSTPIKETTEGSVACLAFSPDNSLILFCIQKIDEDQYFYIWDVKTSTLTGPLCIDRSVRFHMHVDSFCFSSDNSKLFFCNAFSVLILKHDAKDANVTTLQKRSINSHPSDICSHCTVSCDDKLLACCIANEILIYSVDDLDRFYKVPHNHLGKIEFCKFLCGKRYLISYGMDRLMFLFDLVARQSIAYLRLYESCRSVAISAKGDKIVCLESSNKMSLITLRGLQSDLISNLELPSMANHAPQGVRIVVAPVHQIELEDDPYLIHGDYLVSSGSSDEYVSEDEMHNNSDQIIHSNHSGNDIGE